MSIEKQLRDTLHRVADDLGPTEPASNVRAEGMRTLAHRRSRQRIAVVSAGLAAVLVAVAVPVGLSALSSAEDRDVENRVAAPASPSPDVSIFGGPTRGSLAGDTAFVEAVRRLSWTRGAPEIQEGLVPPVDARRVVFVGDVTAGRWAMVVGDLAVAQARPSSSETAFPTDETPSPPDETPSPTTDTLPQTEETVPPRYEPPVPVPTGLVALWFAGPSGATLAQMEPVSTPAWISPDQPASLYDVPTGSLVVVAAPGDVIEISARPEVAADATVSRNFLDAGSSDGLLVTDLGPSYGGATLAARYRVTRSGVVLAEQKPDWSFSPFSDEGQALPEPELSYLRPPADGYFGEANGMAYDILGEYGLLPDQVELQVHYVGSVPGVNGTPDELTVLTATFPSGAVLTRAETVPHLVGDEPDEPVEGASAGRGVCANTLSAAGVPAAQRIVALRCDVESGKFESDPAFTTSTLVVIAPPDLAEGYAVAEGSSGPITLDLADGGIGMVAFPDGAKSVIIHAADGTVLEEVPISTV